MTRKQKLELLKLRAQAAIKDTESTWNAYILAIEPKEKARRLEDYYAASYYKDGIVDALYIIQADKPLGNNEKVHTLAPNLLTIGE